MSFDFSEDDVSWLWTLRPGTRVRFDPARLRDYERRARQRKADDTVQALLASLDTGVWDRLARRPPLDVIRPQPTVNGAVHATPTPTPPATLRARRALEQFDSELAAFDAKHRERAVTSVTISDVANFHKTSRKRYYRLLEQAGLKETPNEYIQRRLPELRHRGAR